MIIVNTVLTILFLMLMFSALVEYKTAKNYKETFTRLELETLTKFVDGYINVAKINIITTALLFLNSLSTLLTLMF